MSTPIGYTKHLVSRVSDILKKYCSQFGLLERKDNVIVTRAVSQVSKRRQCWWWVVGCLSPYLLT